MATSSNGTAERLTAAQDRLQLLVGRVTALGIAPAAVGPFATDELLAPAVQAAVSASAGGASAPSSAHVLSPLGAATTTATPDAAGASDADGAASSPSVVSPDAVAVTSGEGTGAGAGATAPPVAPALPPSQPTAALNATAVANALAPPLHSVVALVVQRSSLPLSALAPAMLERLQAVPGADVLLKGMVTDEEGVKKLITTVATRKSYGVKPTDGDDANEDAQADRVWRWEVSNVVLFPKDVRALVALHRRLARAVGAQVKSAAKVVSLLTQCKAAAVAKEECALVKHVQAEVSASDALKARAERDAAAAAKRAEREAAAAARAQAAEAKRQAAAEKEAAAAAAKAAKAAAKAAKEQAKEEAKRAKEQAKEAAKRAKEEAKRAKEEAKENARKTKKQKAMPGVSIMQFLVKKPEAAVTAPTVAGAGAGVAVGADTPADPPASAASDPASAVGVPASAATVSRRPTQRRRNGPVARRFKLVQFWENERPPLWGVFHKKPAAAVAVDIVGAGAGVGVGAGAGADGVALARRVLTGRLPFAKDTSLFDYDVDSDAEWEGDDVEGEELVSGDDEEDAEEGNALDYEDGWLCQDTYVEYDGAAKQKRIPIAGEDSDDTGDDGADSSDDDYVADDLTNAATAAGTAGKAKAEPAGDGVAREPCVVGVAYTLPLGDCRFDVLRAASPFVYARRPVALPSPDSPARAGTSKRARESSVHSSPRAPGIRKRVVNEADVPMLMELAHNAACGIDRLVAQFRERRPDSSASTAQVKARIRQVAERKPVPVLGGRQRWQVLPAAAVQYNWTIPPPPPAARPAATQQQQPRIAPTLVAPAAPAPSSSTAAQPVTPAGRAVGAPAPSSSPKKPAAAVQASVKRFLVLQPEPATTTPPASLPAVSPCTPPREGQ